MLNELLKSCLKLCHPLGLTWLLLTVWLVRTLWLRRWYGALLPTLAWLLLTTFTCTPFTSWLMAGLENQVPRVPIASLPVADAIICLGGAGEPSLTEPTGFHFRGAADRVSTAVSVAAAGKSNLIILGGGAYKEDGRPLAEADFVLAHLQQARATTAALHSLGACADTHDEAVKVAALAKERGLKSFLLVTSAAHMPRSVAVFQKAGLEVTPVPCNYLSSYHQVGARKGRFFHLPSIASFETFTSWFHEIVGMWVYRWRGWV